MPMSTIHMRHKRVLTQHHQLYMYSLDEQTLLNAVQTNQKRDIATHILMVNQKGEHVFFDFFSVDENENEVVYYNSWNSSHSMTSQKNNEIYQKHLMFNITKFCGDMPPLHI